MPKYRWLAYFVAFGAILAVVIVAQDSLYKVASYLAGVQVFIEPRVIRLAPAELSTTPDTVVIDLEVINRGPSTATIFGVNTPCGVKCEQRLPITIDAKSFRKLRVFVSRKALSDCNTSSLTFYCDKPILDEGQIIFVLDKQTETKTDAGPAQQF